jgi:hypothetical protein
MKVEQQTHRAFSEAEIREQLHRMHALEAFDCFDFVVNFQRRPDDRLSERVQFFFHALVTCTGRARREAKTV